MARPVELSAEEVAVLLSIARRTLESVVAGGPAPLFSPPRELQNLYQPCGAFVTLRGPAGRLRGCIGRLSADVELHRIVCEMTVAAATQDPRFAHERIQPAELPYIFVELSVLSPLEKVSNPLAEIQPGVHGVYVRRGNRTGCFLPQVATEMRWDARQLLEHCCARKAGLPADAWQEPDVEVFRFTSRVYEEPRLTVSVPQDPAGPLYVQPC